MVLFLFMSINELHQIIENASLSEQEKNELKRIADFGLSSNEQMQLAEQMRNDPQLLYQLNDIIKKKHQYINDPDVFDEILKEEEALLDRLKG